MVQSYDEWGRENWERVVEDAGYGGNPERLWDAMVNAREQCWTSLTPPEIAGQPEKFDTFCNTVCSLLGQKVASKVIGKALLAMPRMCSYCEGECWEWCDDCGGWPDLLRFRRSLRPLPAIQSLLRMSGMQVSYAQGQLELADPAF